MSVPQHASFDSYKLENRMRDQIAKLLNPIIKK